MNYRLTLQYDGTNFHGWQIQRSEQHPAPRTVQGELTRALTIIDGHSVAVHGAGRTDAGVHAAAQVANVHLRREITGKKLQAAINGNLASDVRIIDAHTITDDFHARFSAAGKTYCYQIFNAPFISPFWCRYAHHEARPLDVERMQQAARLFLGEHEWSAFSAAQSDVVGRVRTITELEIDVRWSERGHGRLISIAVSANGFLRYMVRSIVGTLLAVGRGAIDTDTVAQAITSGNRTLVGATAPACGLTLMRVCYTEGYL